MQTARALRDRQSSATRAAVIVTDACKDTLICFSPAFQVKCLRSNVVTWPTVAWPPLMDLHLIDLGHFHSFSVYLSLFPAEMKRAALVLWGPQSKCYPPRVRRKKGGGVCAGHKAFRFKGCYHHQKLTTVSSSRDDCLWLSPCLLLSAGGYPPWLNTC